ncbi:uncharacterized protein LOC101235976 isoform X2 [Hydra vulgaris]|uniref:Uncharacterized protein LOC101235976 isoform X2 n=1 Tax=Hydra vulgaris TaxID=6087 RepID=A0ABM4BYC2_HYDVU
MVLYVLFNWCLVATLTSAIAKDTETVSWLPPWLMAAIIDQDHTGKIRVDDGCDMVYHSNNCTIHLKPIGSSCKQLLNFRNIFKDQSKLEVFFNLTDSTFPSDNFYIYNVNVGLCNNDITFVTKNIVSNNFIDRYILLSDVKMEIVLKGFEKFDQSKISIRATGKGMINDKQYKITITKTFFNDFFNIKLNAHKVHFEDLLITFRIEKIFYKGLCILNKKVLEALVAKKIFISGIYDFNRGFYFSGNVVFVDPHSKRHLSTEIIVLREPHQPLKFGVIIKGSIHQNILPLLEDMLKRKQSNVPLIDDVGHGFLSISSHNILRANFDKNIRPRAIPKGVVLQTISKLNEIHKSQSEVSNNDTLGLRLVKLIMCSKKDQVEFNPNNNIDLHKFLGRISTVKNDYFPSWLKTNGIVYVKVEKLEYSGPNKSNILLKLKLKTSLKVLFGTIKINKINFDLIMDRSHKPNQWICGFSSVKKSIGSIEFKVSISCDKGLKNFRIIIESVYLRFSKLLGLLHIDKIPYELKKNTNQLYNFDIKALRIEESQNQFLRLTGVPLLFGMENLAMEGIIWQEGVEKWFAIGIVLKDVDFIDMLKKLTGTKLNAFWVGKTTTSILLSNTNSSPAVYNKIHNHTIRLRRDTTREYLDNTQNNNMATNSLFTQPNYRQYFSDFLQHNEVASPSSQNTYLNPYIEPLQQQIPQQVSFFNSKFESNSDFVDPKRVNGFNIMNTLSGQPIASLNTLPGPSITSTNTLPLQQSTMSGQPINSVNIFADHQVSTPSSEHISSMQSYMPASGNLENLKQENFLKGVFPGLNTMSSSPLLKENDLNNGSPVPINKYPSSASFGQNVESLPASDPVTISLANPFLYSQNSFLPTNFAYQPQPSSLTFNKNSIAPTVSIMNSLMEAYHKINMQKMKENQNQAKNIEAGIIDMMADKRSLPLSIQDSLVHNNLYDIFMNNADAMMRSLSFSKNLVTHDDKRKSKIPKPDSLKVKHSKPLKTSKNKSSFIKKRRKKSVKKKNVLRRNYRNKKRSEIKHKDIKNNVDDLKHNKNDIKKKFGNFMSSKLKNKTQQDVENIKNVSLTHNFSLLPHTMSNDSSSIYKLSSQPSTIKKVSKVLKNEQEKISKKTKTFKQNASVARDWVEVHIPETAEDFFNPSANEDENVHYFKNKTPVVINDLIGSFAESIAKSKSSDKVFFNERLGLSRPNITGLNERANISDNSREQQITNEAPEEKLHNISFSSVMNNSLIDHKSFSKNTTQELRYNSKIKTTTEIDSATLTTFKIINDKVDLTDNHKKSLKFINESHQPLESIEQKSLHDVIWFGSKYSTDPEVFDEYNPKLNSLHNNSIVNKTSENINNPNTKIVNDPSKHLQQFTYIVPESTILTTPTSSSTVKVLKSMNTKSNPKNNIKISSGKDNIDISSGKDNINISSGTNKSKNIIAVKDDVDDIEVITNPGIHNHSLKSGHPNIFKLSLTDGDIDDIRSISQKSKNKSSVIIDTVNNSTIKAESNTTVLNRSLSIDNENKLFLINTNVKHINKTIDNKIKKNDSKIIVDKVQQTTDDAHKLIKDNIGKTKSDASNQTPDASNQINNGSLAIDILKDLLENNRNFNSETIAPNGTAPKPEKLREKSNSGTNETKLMPKASNSVRIEQSQNSTKDIPKDKKLKKPITLKDRSSFVSLNESSLNNSSNSSDNFYLLIDNKTEFNNSINISKIIYFDPGNVSSQSSEKTSNSNIGQDEYFSNMKSDEEEEKEEEKEEDGIISNEIDQNKIKSKETPSYNHTLSSENDQPLTQKNSAIHNENKSINHYDFLLDNQNKEYSFKNESDGDPIEEVEHDFDEIDLVKKSDPSKSTQALHDDSDDTPAVIDDSSEDNVYAKKLHDYLYNNQYKEYEDKSSDDRSQVNEYLNGDTDNLDNIAQIVSMYKSKLKHESATKFLEIKKKKKTRSKNKKLYLVKNKKLQVVMEIRPDSKSNKISVETQGIDNLFHPFIDNKFSINRKKLLSNFSGDQVDSQNFITRKYPAIALHKKGSTKILKSNNKKDNHNEFYTNLTNSKKKILLDVLKHLNRKRYQKEYQNSQEKFLKSSFHRWNRKLLNKPKIRQDLQSKLSFLKNFNLFEKELNKGKFTKHWKDKADIDGGVENIVTSQFNSLKKNDFEKFSDQDTQKKNKLNQTYVDVTTDSDPLEIFQGSKFEGSHLLSNAQKKNVQVRLINSSSTLYPVIDDSVRNEVSSALTEVTKSKKKTNSHDYIRDKFHETTTSDGYKMFSSIPNAYDLNNEVLRNQHPIIYNDSIVEFFKRNSIPINNHSLDSDDIISIFKLAELEDQFEPLPWLHGTNNTKFLNEFFKVKLKDKKVKKKAAYTKHTKMNRTHHFSSHYLSSKKNSTLEYINSSTHLISPIKEAIKNYLSQHSQSDVMTNKKISLNTETRKSKESQRANETINKSKQQFLEEFAEKNLKGIDEKILQLKNNLETVAYEDAEQRLTFKDIERLKGITDKINEFKMSLNNDLEANTTLPNKTAFKNESANEILSSGNKFSWNNTWSNILSSGNKFLWSKTWSNKSNNLSDRSESPHFFLKKKKNHFSLNKKKNNNNKPSLLKKKKNHIKLQRGESKKFQNKNRKNYENHKNSTVYNYDKKFRMQDLKNITIVEGVSLYTTVLQSDFCRDGDELCLLIKRNVISNAPLYLKGVFVSGEIELTAPVPVTSQFTKTWSIEFLQLVMQIKKSSSNVFVRAELVFRDENLRFNGKIALGANGLQLSMSMKDQWRQPFGVDYIVINNPIFTTSYNVDSLSYFEMRGNFSLGIIDSKNALKGELHIGYNPNDPSANYFYGEINSLTVKNLLNAFNKTVMLPQVIESSYFPHGLLVSYSSNPYGYRIVEKKLKIDYGFMLSGYINFIGYKVFCVIKITTAEITMNILMPSMEFGGGFVQMQSSEDDLTHGPSMVLHIAKDEVLVQAVGEASMLGVHGPSLLLISNDTFKLKMKANFYDLIEGTLLLEAGTDEGLSSAKFRLDSCLNIKEEKLKEAIINRINSIIENGNSTLQRAIGKHEEIVAMFDHTKETLEEMKRTINDKERELFSDSHDIVESQKLIATNCFQKCPKVCQSGFTFKKKCTKVLHRWISCRNFEECYRKRPQIDCILECEQKKFLQKGFNFVTRKRALKNFLALKSQWKNLFLYESLLQKIPLKMAEELVSSVSTEMHVADKVVDLLTLTPKNDVFKFQHFCIWGNLAELNDFCVAFNMSITLFKQDMSTSDTLCINEKVFITLGADVVNKQYPEIVEMEKVLVSKEKDFEKLKHEKIKIDKLLTNLRRNFNNQEVTADFMEHYYIPNSNEEYFNRIIRSSVPGYLFHPDIIFSLYGPRKEFSTSYTSNSSLHRKTVKKNCDDYCSCLTRTIHIYNEIANGLNTVLSSVKQEKDYHIRTRDKLKKIFHSNISCCPEFAKKSSYETQKFLDLQSSLDRSYRHWLNVTFKQLVDYEKNVVPDYISQVSDIFPDSDLQSFLNKLNQQAKSSVKRSEISGRTKVMEIDNIDEIKLGLEKLLFLNISTSIDEKIALIRELKKKLLLARTLGKLCKVSRLTSPVKHSWSSYSGDYEDPEER